MGEADEAYRAAVAEIARVRAKGGTQLDFRGERFRALDRIPPQIAEVSGLVHLDLTQTRITDLRPLAGLSALKMLDLSSTGVTDLSPLEGLSALETLGLEGTGVTDLSPLAGLAALKRLGLSSTGMTDLFTLEGLAALEMLVLSSAEVTDLSPLAGLSALKTLELSDTDVTDLSPLEGLAALETLVLSGTEVTDLSPLEGLSALKRLELSDTDVTDLSPLAGLSALKTLWLDNTGVTDLSPLIGLAGLETLRLDSTAVSDLSPLTGLAALKTLALHSTRASDLRPLRDLAKLGTDPLSSLWFTRTPFAAATDETRRLAAIEDSQERTRQTLAFLKTLPPWPEPLPWEAADIAAAAAAATPVPQPGQDPALPLVWGERGFAFLADHIGIDPVTREVLADLRALLDALIRQSGNTHEDLYRLATEMRARCEPEAGKLDALRLHLSFQKLERLDAARAGRERPFDTETGGTLDAILALTPGVTLADTQVQTLIARQEANRAAPPAPADAARAGAVLAAVQPPDAPFAPDVRDLAAAAGASGPQDRLAAAQPILARNIVVAVGQRLSRILASPGDLVASGILIGWAHGQAGPLTAYALSMGRDAAVWITRILRELGRVAPPL